MSKPIVTTYGELQNGDKVYVQGYLFAVSNLSAHPNYSNPTGPTIIRFTGSLLDRDSDIFRTSYNGGTYGGNADISCTRLPRPEEQ